MGRDNRRRVIGIEEGASRSRPTVELLSFACPKESNQSKRHPPVAYILCLSASSGAACGTQPGSQQISLATADFEQFAPLNPDPGSMQRRNIGEG